MGLEFNLHKLHLYLLEELERVPDLKKIIDLQSIDAILISNYHTFTALPRSLIQVKWPDGLRKVFTDASHFRWLNIKGFDAAFLVSIRFFSTI